MSLFDSIHHVAIIVSDYDKSKEFYVNKLGFKIIRENYRKERDDWKMDLKINESTELEIFSGKNNPERPSFPEALGLRHLAFKVESVNETVKLLSLKGIVSEDIRFDEFTGKAMTFFKDPDNMPIEIHE